jgi:hypothetical protein
MSVRIWNIVRGDLALFRRCYWRFKSARKREGEFLVCSIANHHLTAGIAILRNQWLAQSLLPEDLNIQVLISQLISAHLHSDFRKLIRCTIYCFSYDELRESGTDRHRQCLV